MATPISRPRAVESTDPVAPAAPARRRPPAALVAAVLVLAIAGWGLKQYLGSRNRVSSDNAQIEGHVTPVAARIQAFVSSIRVDDNQPVKQGDTLVVLDQRDLEVKLRSAEADLAAAQAGHGKGGGQAAAQLSASEAQASSMQSSIAAAEANFRKAQADLDRYKGLAQRQIISAQQLDAAQATFDAASANLDAMKKSAAASTQQVSAFSAGARVADARLEAAQAAVANARLQLSYAILTAPANGVVARRSVEIGALVQPGQTLMSLLPTDTVWVTANLKETEIENVSPGDVAEFKVDAYPDHQFTGKVESISPATGARFALLPPDNATGNFTKVVQRVPVRIAVDHPDPRYPLRPGMSVVVSIKTK
ncbi:MAG: HlyD family secretion protein [Gemmatimonadota bacterium]